MELATNIAALEEWLKELPSVGIRALRGNNAPIYILDFIMIGAVKRTMSLASALPPMIEAKNMLCARALLRMHLDTVTRLLVYTYVANPEQVAKAVIKGTQLKKFKSRSGQSLTDAYLVQRLSLEHPWVERVYKSTSGYVHFSERQFFDSIESIDEKVEGLFHLRVGKTDDNYPESSWVEVIACFNHLTRLLAASVDSYVESKTANPAFERDSPEAGCPSI